MPARHDRLRLFACTTGLLLALGCARRDAPPTRPAGDPGAEAIAADSEVIVVRFHDSSVPPPGHRSHTITITRAEIRRVVDSYGTLLDDRRAPIDATVLDGLLGSLAQQRVRPAEHPTDGAGCTGGTAHGILVERDDAIVLEGSLSHCGGEWSDLDGNPMAFVAEVERIADARLGPDDADARRRARR